MRLTEKKDSGSWCLRDVPWNQLKPGAVITKEIWEKLYGTLWKLKDYEDTGLSPEEVESVNDFEKSQTYRAIAELQEEREKHRWIPVTEKLPEPETYILVSFDNCTLPDIATYRVGDDGSGAFYQGDEDYMYLSVGLFVNAWMPLPKPAGKTTIWDGLKKLENAMSRELLKRFIVAFVNRIMEIQEKGTSYEAIEGKKGTITIICGSIQLTEEDLKAIAIESLMEVLEE